MNYVTWTMGMEHYKFTLSEPERAELQALTGKGTHAASKANA